GHRPAPVSCSSMTSGGGGAVLSRIAADRRDLLHQEPATTPHAADAAHGRSASRAEEDAPPVALDGYERARAHAREPPDVPPAREDVGPGAVVEEHAEGALRYETVARAET